MVQNTHIPLKENLPMKNKMSNLLMVATIVLILLIATIPVFASGGQVRGDKALGPAYQVQVQDPPPFQP
jgi:hypothetical protein